MSTPEPTPTDLPWTTLESTLTLCQSRLYPLVRDFGFGLWLYHFSCTVVWVYCIPVYTYRETREGCPLLTVETDIVWGLKEYQCKGSFLGWFVQNIFFLTYTISIPLSPSPSKLGRQPCWVACLLVSVSGCSRNDQYHTSFYSIADSLENIYLARNSPSQTFLAFYFYVYFLHERPVVFLKKKTSFPNWKCFIIYCCALFLALSRCFYFSSCR